MRILWLDETNLPGLPLATPFTSVAHSAGDAVAALREEVNSGVAPVALIARLPLSSSSPGQLLEWVRLYSPATKVFFFREHGTTQEALTLASFGARDYFDAVPLPEDIEALLNPGEEPVPVTEEEDDCEPEPILDAVSTAPETATEPPAHVTSQPSLEHPFDSNEWRKRLVGTSDALRRVADTIALIANRRSTVLILGETGTGKELVARAIHEASQRAAMPMIPVNCGAIPENLIEAELFGHVKGAFTGATAARVGRFEQAHHGTLFLDEIADLPLDLQAKLLRALQEREFQRVGSSETVKVDVRVIAATNVRLLERVQQGKFREDLYYRLNVVPILVPPLRDHPEDIPGLLRHFVKKVCHLERIPAKTVTPDALAELVRYPWPGNVRQLENTIEMAVILSGDRTLLDSNDFNLTGTPRASQPVQVTADQLVPLPEGGLDFEAVISRIELNLLEQALRRANGNKKAAAEILGLKRTTLAAKLKSLEPLAADQSLVRTSGVS
jgi:DNA-binding NtrC family response regulator